MSDDRDLLTGDKSSDQEDGSKEEEGGSVCTAVILSSNSADLDSDTSGDD